MKRLVAGALVLAWAGSGLSEETKTEYFVQAVVGKLPPGAGKGIEETLLLGKKKIAFPEGRPQVVVELDPRMLSVTREPHVEIIQTPRMTVFSGQKGGMSVKEYGIIYMEKLPSGDFRLKSDPDWLGVELEVLMAPSDEPGTLRCDVRAKVRAIAGRDPIPNVPLDIGKPIVRTRTLDTRFATPEEGSLAVIFPEPDDGSPKDGEIFILLSIGKSSDGIPGIVIKEAGKQKSVMIMENVPIEIKTGKSNQFQRNVRKKGE